MKTLLRLVPFAALVALIIALPTPSVVAEEGLNQTQRQEIEGLIQKYIMNNPKVIIEAVQKMQSRAEQEKKAQATANLSVYREQLINASKSPVTGNPQGDVTIVEFFDYRCGYCKRVSPALMKAVKADGNVRLVYKEFPILGPESVVASKASLAVWRLAPEKYKAYHSALMSARGSITERMVLSEAAKLGLDKDAIAAEMKSSDIEDELSENYQLAQSLGITGTPAFIIGNELIPGAVDFDTLEGLIKQAREG